MRKNRLLMGITLMWLAGVMAMPVTVRANGVEDVDVEKLVVEHEPDIYENAESENIDEADVVVGNVIEETSNAERILGSMPRTTGLYEENGEWLLYEDGVWLNDYNDLYYTGINGSEPYNYYYIRNGVWNSTYSSIDDWYCVAYSSRKYGSCIVKNGIVDTDFTGVGYITFLTRMGFFVNGFMDKTYNGLYISETGEVRHLTGSGGGHSGTQAVKINDGYLDIHFSGLYNDNVYGWVMIRNGYVDTTCNGMYATEHDGWIKIKDGMMDKSYYDLCYSEVLGWVKVAGGVFDWYYNDAYYSPTFGWCKIIGGYLDAGYNDIYGSPTIGWWKFTGGFIDFGYSDVYYSPTYGWWKVANGCVDFGYYDVYYSPTIGWWKIAGGCIDFGYSDIYYSPTIGWWKVAGGCLDLGYNDVYCSPAIGWWKITNGCLDFYSQGVLYSPIYGRNYIIVNGACFPY